MPMMFCGLHDRAKPRAGGRAGGRGDTRVLTVGGRAKRGRADYAKSMGSQPLPHLQRRLEDSLRATLRKIFFSSASVCARPRSLRRSIRLCQ
jgi:hypothetical protein